MHTSLRNSVHQLNYATKYNLNYPQRQNICPCGPIMFLNDVPLCTKYFKGTSVYVVKIQFSTLFLSLHSFFGIVN